MPRKKKASVSGVPPNIDAMPLDHVHRAHAVLSASAAKRWLNCPPSARLNEQFPNVSSEFAEEGTAAHELCEYKVRKYLHDRIERPQSKYSVSCLIPKEDKATLAKMPDNCPPDSYSPGILCTLSDKVKSTSLVYLFVD